MVLDISTILQIPLILEMVMVVSRLATTPAMIIIIKIKDVQDMCADSFIDAQNATE